MTELAALYSTDHDSLRPPLTQLSSGIFEYGSQRTRVLGGVRPSTSLDYYLVEAGFVGGGVGVEHLERVGGGGGKLNGTHPCPFDCLAGES